MNTLNIKEITHHTPLGIPKGMQNAISICVVPGVQNFDQELKHKFRGVQNRKPFEITLLVE